MIFVVSLAFLLAAIMKLKGFNLIHKIKKISVERSENKENYDKLVSKACFLIGAVLLVFDLKSSRWFYGLPDSEIFLYFLGAVLFISVCLIIYAPIAYREGIVGNFLSRVENNPKKKRILCGSYILDVLLVSALLVWSIFKNTEYGYRVEFYFMWMDTAIAVFVLTTLIIVSLLFAVALTLYKKKGKVFLSVAVALIAFHISLFICAWTTGGDYYSYYSPDLKRSIVLEEWTFLTAESVWVYERENLFFIRRIGDLSGVLRSDFGLGAYSVEWEENKVIITAHKNRDDAVICEFELSD